MVMPTNSPVFGDVGAIATPPLHGTQTLKLDHACESKKMQMQCQKKQFWVEFRAYLADSFKPQTRKITAQNASNLGPVP